MPSKRRGNCVLTFLGFLPRFMSILVHICLFSLLFLELFRSSRLSLLIKLIINCSYCLVGEFLCVLVVTLSIEFSLKDCFVKLQFYLCKSISASKPDSFIEGKKHDIIGLSPFFIQVFSMFSIFSTLIALKVVIFCSCNLLCSF